MPHTQDYQNLIAHKQFLEDVENGVRVANREIIHAHIPTLNRDKFLEFAVAVARLRAGYLDAALALFVGGYGPDWPDEAALVSLRSLRKTYLEGMRAFEALRRAIERGYVDLDKAANGTN
ncbi:MAG: hypothetical protein FJX56_00015 [Alphaproteobacteria bacterium]|nr:hypothetical protein [Alphaproteobacteria bacterium]